MLVGLFQMGTLFVHTVEASETFIEAHILRNKPVDLSADNILKWELLGYAILALIGILVQMLYMKLVSTKPDGHKERDTLLTTE